MTTKEDQQPQVIHHHYSFWSKLGDGCGCGAGCLCICIGVAVVLWAVAGFPAFWK